MKLDREFFLQFECEETKSLNQMFFLDGISKVFENAEVRPRNTTFLSDSTELFKGLGAFNFLVKFKVEPQNK